MTIMSNDLRWCPVSWRTSDYSLIASIESKPKHENRYICRFRPLRLRCLTLQSCSARDKSATKEEVMNEDILIDLGDVSEETKGEPGGTLEGGTSTEKQPPPF